MPPPQTPSPFRPSNLGRRRRLSYTTAPNPNPTTWNPADKTASLTLTGGNLTATCAAGNQGVRAADKQIGGKFYWEVACPVVAGVGIGLASLGFSLTGGLAAGAGYCGLNSGGSVSIDGASAVTGLGTIANGGVACIAVDLTARLIWFRVGAAGNWNGSASADPATGAGGLAHTLGQGVPAYPIITGVSATQITANFGSYAFAGAVPDGFTAGFTAGATPPVNALATQVAVEHFAAPTPDAQVTQVAVEHFAVPNVPAQVTQVALEEWLTTSPPAQVTQTALEEWASVANVIPPTGGFVGNTPPTRSPGSAGVNSIFLTKVTAQQNGVAKAVLLDLPAAVAGPIGFRALVYDSAHSALLASGPIVTALTADYNRLPLSAPLTLSAGTDYWVGYVCDTTFNATIGVMAGLPSWWANGGQSVASPANPLAAGAASTSGLLIALELDAAGALAYGFATDRATSVALSGSNRIATFAAVANQGAHSVVTRLPGNGGKWYAEVDVGGTINSGVGVGLTSAAWGVIQPPSATINTLAYTSLLLSTGVISNLAISTALTYAAGDTLGVAYDAVHNLLWFNKNNGAWVGASASVGDPVAGTLGAAVQTAPWPISVAAATGAATAAAFTLRDTADALRYTPPSGYAAWSGYALPTYIPPPSPAVDTSKGQQGKDKGKGPLGKVQGPPALRAEGRFMFLAPARRRKVSAIFSPPITSKILVESAATAAALAATVVHPAALSASAITSAAVAGGRLLAAVLAEGVTTAAALAASRRVLSALAESGHGAEALNATAKLVAQLAASTAASDAPRTGEALPSALSASAVTSATLTAFLAAKGSLAEGSAATTAIAGFRTLRAALAEAGQGSDALAGAAIRTAFLADGAATHDALSALAKLLAQLAETTDGEDGLVTTKLVHAAIAEAASTFDADTYVATNRPFRGSEGLAGERQNPDLRGRRSSADLTGERSNPKLEGET